MAFLRQNASGTWQVRWREGGRGSKEQTETLDNHASAVKFRGLVDAAGGRWPEGWVKGVGLIEQKASDAPTLAQWFARTEAANVRANSETLDKYRRSFEEHVPVWLATRTVDSISAEDVGRWINELRSKTSVRTKQPLSHKTIHNVHGAVSTAMRLAVRDGHAHRNPFEGALTGVTREDREDMVFLEADEFERLYTAMDPHYQPLVALLYATGMRYSEATALHWRDYDPERQTLRVRQAWTRRKAEDGSNFTVLGPPKTARGKRVIRLSEDEDLWLRTHRGAPSQLIFRTVEGERIKHQFFHARKWQPAVAMAMQLGLTKKPRIHDLRHSHAAWLLSNGVPLLAVSRRLGHASIQVTADTYGHLTAEVDDGIAAAVARGNELRRESARQMMSKPNHLKAV